MSIQQKYKCDKTSRNCVSKVITLSLPHIPSGSTVLDYGGGRYDKGVERYAQHGILSFVYDPFNRSAEHNAQIKDNYDFAVCGNVLNVLENKSLRRFVIHDIMKRTQNCFIKVYEGDQSGKAIPTRDGFQLNQPINFYREEIKDFGFQVVSLPQKLLLIQHQNKNINTTIL